MALYTFSSEESREISTEGTRKAVASAALWQVMTLLSLAGKAETLLHCLLLSPATKQPWKQSPGSAWRKPEHQSALAARTNEGKRKPLCFPSWIVCRLRKYSSLRVSTSASLPVGKEGEGQTWPSRWVDELGWPLVGWVQSCAEGPNAGSSACAHWDTQEAAELSSPLPPEAPTIRKIYFF